MSQAGSEFNTPWSENCTTGTIISEIMRNKKQRLEVVREDESGNLNLRILSPPFDQNSPVQ